MPVLYTCQYYILPEAPRVDHREVIMEPLWGLVKRIRLRVWFLYADTLLYGRRPQ